jgi:cytochrome o ubiquinol oxidase subunit 2
MHGLRDFVTKVRNMSKSQANGTPIASGGFTAFFRYFQRHRGAAGYALCAGAVLLLNGCSLELFSPKGDIGTQERNLIVVASVLMLMVVIPVIVMSLYFAWQYRESNKKATYAPKWAHSTKIELVVWTIPVVIVAFLSVLIWRTTHSLDPYKPIKSDVAPVRVEVVALNWKWLFIYPDYGIATVNRLAIPTNVPIDFKITSASMMNSFFIPQLGSQIYSMAGMQTQLHLTADTPGVYAGMSASFSGPGFSDMHFDTVATSRGEFDAWIEQVKKSPLTLDKEAYRALEKDSIKNPVALYSSVDSGLFDCIVNQYMHGAGASDMSMKHMAMQHTHAKAMEGNLCSAS